MQRKQWKAPKEIDTPKASATKASPVKETADLAERMRQATKPDAKKKSEKTRTIDDVIALLHKHGIRFNDEE